MSEQYELTTIRDIFDKVPADRIQECCEELGILLAQTKATASLAGYPTECVTIDLPIVWADDGKGELSMELENDNGEALVIETKRSANLGKAMGGGE